MGYIGVYRVYDNKNKSLGQFSGWTSDEAIKRAKKAHPTKIIGKCVYLGDQSEVK